MSPCTLLGKYEAGQRCLERFPNHCCSLADGLIIDTPSIIPVARLNQEPDVIGSTPVGAESYAKVEIGALATGIRR